MTRASRKALKYRIATERDTKAAEGNDVHGDRDHCYSAGECQVTRHKWAPGHTQVGSMSHTWNVTRLDRQPAYD